MACLYVACFQYPTHVCTWNKHMVTLIKIKSTTYVGIVCTFFCSFREAESGLYVVKNKNLPTLNWAWICLGLGHSFSAAVCGRYSLPFTRIITYKYICIGKLPMHFPLQLQWQSIVSQMVSYYPSSNEKGWNSSYIHWTMPVIDNAATSVLCYVFPGPYICCPRRT